MAGALIQVWGMKYKKYERERERVDKIVVKINVSIFMETVTSKSGSKYTNKDKEH